MTDHGDTRDLRQPPPEAARVPTDEARTRRFGQCNYRAGWAIVVSAVVGALITAVLTGNGLWHGTDTQFFLMIALVGLIVLGGQLVGAGALERNMRPVRDRQRENSALQTDGDEWIRKLLERLTEETRGRYDNSHARHQELLGYVASIPARLLALEELVAKLEVVVEKVPQYPEAVLDGFDLARGMAGDSQERG